ncbi:hypothetical protein [Pleomorphomonas sp. PLEO]|uniref:hypothetical protein n=1 Tax=Pleomorphomonas sp. PLEO TaxID=3239306 RepID=UPI00351F1EB4
MAEILTLKRWTATIAYRTDAGPKNSVYGIEELGEIQDIVERGPDWNSIDQITIKLGRRMEPPTFTVEDGERK